MSEEVFGVKEVSFSYGLQAALKDVSFSLCRGETLAMLGASGAGKTTLLKVVSGLISPSSGTVDFLGKPLAGHWLKKQWQGHFRAKVGFVFSEPDVQLFCPTVYDELAFGPLQMDMSRGQVAERVEQTLSLLQIEGLRDRAPQRLSSGEKKKVQLAAVLTVNPEVILLDEPTFGLDPRTQVWLLELLLRLQEAGKTFLLATHDLSLVEDFSKRAIVLSESHGLVAHGPTGKILSNEKLLLQVNLIHEHAHRHGTVVHKHSHGPYSSHDEH